MALPEKIESISKITRGADVTPETLVTKPEGFSPVRGDFSALIEKERPLTVDATKHTLFDEVRDASHKIDPTSRASPDRIVAQTERAIQQIEQVKEVLSSPNIKIQRSVQTILKNKLTHIDESLRIALSKTGIESPSAESVVNGLAGPSEKFLSYLTHGQYQLQQLGDEIAKLGGNQMNAGDMLKVQMKVGIVQQEIEFFSSLLNKSLESIKTIMNVQV